MNKIVKHIKVLVCAPAPPPRGGIATWVEELMAGANGHADIDVRIFNTANSTRGPGQYTVARRLFDGITNLFGLVKGFISAVNINKPDIVHIATSGGLAHYRDFIFILLSKLLNIKVILHLHFGAADDAYHWPLLRKIVFQLCCYFSDSICCLDERISKLSGIRKSRVVRNGMDLPLRQSYCKKTKYITFVGWVIESKGVFDLLKAWEGVESKNDWKLRIIGPASSANVERINIHLDDTVEYLGELSREKVVEHISESLIFALPSHTEGFPYAILEAMSVGCCLVVSDVGGVRSLFDFDTPPGLLVEPGGILQLSKSFNDLLSDENKVNSMGVFSEDLYRKHYTTKEMLNDLKMCWESVSD